MSCGVGCRHGSNPELLWLWHRPVAAALILPLAWGLAYAAVATLEKKKKKQQTKRNVLVCLEIKVTLQHGSCSAEVFVGL